MEVIPRGNFGGLILVQGYFFFFGGGGERLFEALGIFWVLVLPLFDHLRNLKSEVPLSRPSSQNLHDQRRT